MKTIFALALVACLGTLVNAQDTQTPAPAAAPAVVTPAPAAAVARAAPEQKVTLADLRKKHIDAVAALKKNNIDEITALRASMKGKSRDEIMKAVKAKKAEQEVTLKNLEKSDKAEIEQFKKDH